jgi:hypothetical protein
MYFSPFVLITAPAILCRFISVILDCLVRANRLLRTVSVLRLEILRIGRAFGV